MEIALAPNPGVRDQREMTFEQWPSEEFLQDTDWPAMSRQATAAEQDYVPVRFEVIDYMWN